MAARREIRLAPQQLDQPDADGAKARDPQAARRA
jgi:hypothetical protein